MSPEEERELVWQYRTTADQKVFARLHDELDLTTTGRRWALQIVRRDEDAADVCQEALMCLVRWLRSGFRGSCRVKTFFCSIVRSKALNCLRSRRSRERWLESLRDILAQLARNEKLSTNALVERVRTALDGLPKDLRDAVCLADFDGMTCEEAAAQLGIPAGTLRSRRSTAFERLREALFAFYPLSLTYEGFCNLSEEERSRRRQQFEHDNRHWLKLQLKACPVAWVMVDHDGKIVRSGASMDDCPGGGPRMSEWKKGTFSYVFVHPDLAITQDTPCVSGDDYCV